MNRADFGKLIASLRREHEDERGLPWTQERLAEKANQAAGRMLFTPYIIGTIEQGRRSLDTQTLLSLATALQLTSGERKEFFLAASGIDNGTIARPDNDAEKVLLRLMEKLRAVRQPAIIVDCYYDCMACNAAAIELLDLGSVAIGLDSGNKRLFPLNVLEFFLSQEGERHMDALMGDEFSELLRQSVISFRSVSLRYRSTEYFQSLLAQLRRYRLFRRHWGEIYLDDEDYCTDDRSITWSTPKWGPVSWFIASIVGITRVGELQLIVFTPADDKTAAAFVQMMKQKTADAFRFDYSWPTKTPPA